MIIDVLLNAAIIALDAVPVFADRRRRVFADTLVATDRGFALGLETRRKTHYLAIPRGGPAARDVDRFRLSRAEYDRFAADVDAATTFADECRARRHDGRLIALRRRERRGEDPPR